MADAVNTPRIAPGRSCVACRKRKIRCDRGQPCAYCTKLNLECVYPEPAQDRRTEPSEGNLVSRLEKIQGSLARLESRLSPVATLPPSAPQSETTFGSVADRETGKLVVSEGDSRYIESTFWTDLDEQDNDQNLDFERSNGIPSSLQPTPTNESPNHQDEFVFDSNTVPSDLRRLHPPQSQIFALWQIFLDCVDPLLKMIHVPVAQRQLLRATQNLDDIPPAFEAFMFAFYFAAVTSLQCSVSFQTLLKGDRQTLLGRYRKGLEKALNKARFLSMPDIQALQALTLYLICARQSADKTYVWTMTGLAVRIATKLGLHRDPVSLGLPPFVAEMRRRLWWQIVILDVRTAEDNDMEPMLYEHTFDTKFPSNVNDSDLDVNMTQPPAESKTRTDMLFSLTRIKISYEARKLVFSSKFAADNAYPSLSAMEKSKMLETVQQEIEDKWLQNCDTNIPIFFLTATSSLIVLSKMKLTIHHPARSGSSALSHELLIDLIGTAIEIIEYTHTLRTSEKYAKWVWLFQKYIEWDAVAFVSLPSYDHEFKLTGSSQLLHNLMAAPVPTIADKIWAAVDVFFRVWQGHALDGEQRWRRLERLRAKAQAHRTGPNISAGDQAFESPFPPSVRAEVAVGAYPSQPQIFQATINQGSGIVNGRPEPGTSAAESGDDFNWTFGDMPDIDKAAPSWEMDLDEGALNSWL